MVSVSSLLFSCEVKPQPFNYGVDHCDHCKMGIADQKFGAEIVTRKGKVFKFDAIECMVNFTEEHVKDKVRDIEFFLVADASKPGILIDAYAAHYLLSEKFPSPMGSNISAYESNESLKKFQNEYSHSRNRRAWHRFRS